MDDGRQKLLDQMRQASQAQATADSAETAFAPTMTPPSEGHAYRDPARLARWGALLGSGAFDALSTRAALQRPGVQEANPALRGIANSTPGLLATRLGLNALVGVLADTLHKHGDHGLANILGFGTSAAHTAIGVHNLGTGKK